MWFMAPAPLIAGIVLIVQTLSIGLILSTGTRAEAAYKRILNYLLGGVAFFMAATATRLASYTHLTAAEAAPIEAYFYAAGFFCFLLLGILLTHRPERVVYLGRGATEFYGEA